MLEKYEASIQASKQTEEKFEKLQISPIQLMEVENFYL